MSTAQDTPPGLYPRRLTSQPLQIRLLRLALASSHQPEDDLHCDLLTFELEKAPQYRCVSYCWGKSEWCPIGIITPSSPDEFITYHVTKNLLRCLQQLRESMKRRLFAEGWLWIDVICINQTDDVEKLGQIENMGAIYSGAELVVAWLGWESDRRGDGTDQADDVEGRDEDSTERATEAIREIAVAFRSWTTAGGNAWSEQLSSFAFDDTRCYDALKLRPVPKRTWHAIAVFLRREWWSRAWVCQEVILARRLTFLCGSCGLEFDDILQVCVFLHASGWYAPLLRYSTIHVGRGSFGGQCLYIAAGRKLLGPSSEAATVYGSVMDKRIRNTFDDDRERLTLLVTRLKIYKSSEPRDKVFAPLALSRHVRKHVQDPSPLTAYGAEVSSLYVQMTAHLLQMSSGLSLLSQVDDESLRKQKDLPSWCPDYSVSEFHPPLGDMLVDWYDALPSRRKFCSADVDTQTLILEGLYVENITRLGPSVHKISVQELLEFCLTLHITYHNGQDRTEAVWRTSIADHFSNACPAPTEMTATCFTDWLLYSVANCIHGNNDGQDLPPYEEWSEWSCFDELHESSPTAAKNVPSTAVLAAYTERMRTMLVTSKGSAPEARQLQGGHDFYGSAVLWAGNRTLFVTASGSIGLAPPSSKDGDQVWFVSGAKVPFILRPVEDGRHYRLIGEAYVHGYMHGEVLEEMQDRGFQEIMLR